MKLILFFLCFVFLATQVSSLEFSPVVLSFDVNQNEVFCKKVFFVLESDATVSDFWAVHESVGWRLTQFQISAEQQGIWLSYPSRISSDNTKAEVCLSAARAGNFRGALVFRQEQTGNSIVQFVVWVNLSVAENEEQNNGEDSSSGSSRRSSNNGFYESSTSVPTQTQNFQDLNFEVPKEKIELGNKNSKKVVQTNYLVPLILLLLSFLLGIVVLSFALGRKTKKF